jgi:hypothetical protein
MSTSSGSVGWRQFALPGQALLSADFAASIVEENAGALAAAGRSNRGRRGN